MGLTKQQEGMQGQGVPIAMGIYDRKERHGVRAEAEMMTEHAGVMLKTAAALQEWAKLVEQSGK